MLAAARVAAALCAWGLSGAGRLRLKPSGCFFLQQIKK